MSKINIENFEDYYAKICSDLSNEHFKVLRCDCFNECIGKQIIPSIKGEMTCMELVPERASHVAKMYPEREIIQGDLTNIPKPNEYFDVILDLSTLDHIPDYKKALDEYQRVLAKDGVFYLATWVSPFGYGKGLNMKRDCFNKKEIEQELRKRFYIVANAKLMRRKFRKYIHFREYRCVLKENFNPNETVIADKIGIDVKREF